ncbi:MAG: hypothetical protein KGD64_06805 [Candidatus Heimdallarchaeota archaeon]|nr:hypothetical protein [Candidatus Heimdallarchaeota archaeon]
MKLPNFGKSKRAISPVIATVLLISLVVAASAMVYFIVVPMLRGSSDVDLLTVQWFDSDGDSVTDVAYVTIQNSGTAAAYITSLNVTIVTDTQNETDIDDAFVQGVELPLAIDTTERVDLVLVFDPSDYIEIGTNIFRIRITYDSGLTSFAPDNLRHTDVIEPLDLTILNPIDTSWASGIIDPQAIATGGYKTSAITYDFLNPSDAVLLNDQPVTQNIDSSLYPDDDEYKIDFYVNDSLGQESTIRRTFGIDNDDIGITFGLNDTVINPGDFLSASWTLDIVGAQLVNQTLVLGGDVYPYQQVFTSTEATVTEYILTGSETLQMAEDELVFTLYVKDAAGNMNSAGEAFSLVDNVAPITYFILPLNDTSESGTILLEVYASDPSGIDTTRFDVYFFSLTTSFNYLYQQSVQGEATYIANQNKWVLYFISYILPDDIYSIVAQVYDLSSNGNGNSAVVDAVDIDNDVVDTYGAAAIDGRGGFFRRRGVLSLYVRSLVPSLTLTIETIKLSWGGNSRVTHIWDVYDDTISQVWVDGAAHAEDEEMPVAALQGGVNITATLDHHLTIQFDYGDKPTGVDFIISFYITSAIFTGWESFVIDSV